jgi:hypothetical protein
VNTDRFDEWAAGEVQRVRQEFPSRPVIVGRWKTLLFCAAVGGIIALVACAMATRHGDNVPAWPLMTLAGIVLAVVGWQILSWFDRYRAARYRAGKPPLGRGALLMIAIGGAIVVFVIVALMGAVFFS